MKTCTRAEDRRLRGEEHHHHAQGRIPAERREAGEPLGRDRRRLELAARLVAALDVDEEQEERGDDDEQSRST